jgi:hypothetical protein
MRTQIARFVAYAAGFSISLGSYALLVQFGGNRGSSLGWAVVSLSELIRHTIGLSWERPGGVHNVSTLLACALIALVFLGVFLLATATSRYLRIVGIGLAFALLYLTFYWFRTPLNLF